MKRYAVISVNQNQDYQFFTPLTTWCLEYFGWEVILFYCGVSDRLSKLSFHKNKNIHVLRCIDGYRDATIAQVSRLYAACLDMNDDDLIGTFDVDMLLLSDFINPNPNAATVYGYDLTGYSEFPMCYICMNKGKWADVMGLKNPDGLTTWDYNGMIKRDLDSMPNAKSEDFYKWWGVDQQLITRRLKPHNPTIINRGQYPNGFARGRPDRGSWTLDHKEYIDAHLHHQIHHKGNEWKFNQTMELLTKIWPNESFDWFVEYTQEFKKLTGHL